MASIRADQGRWRLRYSLTLPDGYKKTQKPKKRKNKHQVEYLYHLAVKLEKATMEKFAKKEDIDLWIEEKLLPQDMAKELFPGYADVVEQRGPEEKVDFDRIEAAFGDFMLTRQKAADPNRNTHKNHVNMAKQVVNWLKANHPTLVTLQPKDVIDYKNEMAIKDRLSESTINNRMQKLKYLLDIAVDLNMVQTNAYLESGWKRKKIKPKQSRRIYTVDEIELLKTALSNPFYSTRKIINGCFPIACYLGLYLGLRNEEIAWQTWDSIDLEEATLTVEEVECETTKRVWNPKTVAFRTLGLNGQLKAHLIAEKERQIQEGIYGQFVIVGGGYRAGSKFVTGSRQAKKKHYASVIGDKTLRNSFRAFLKREGIDLKKPEPTFYSFRHTFATMLLRNNTDIATVQHRMGHAEVSTTMGYLAYVNPKDEIVEENLPY